jgi:hypothetical protein
MAKKLNFNKKILIPIIFVAALMLAATWAVFLAGMSGFAVNTTSNSTWGEKQISIGAITVLNNSTMNTYEYNGTIYTYLEGYVQNNNEYDAFSVKMNATAYDESGNVVATNDTVYLEPKNIPAGGESYFYVDFVDQDSKIRKIEVNVVNAIAEL